MYVCICKGVTEGQIVAEIKNGACTMDELRGRLGVCTGCGRCCKCARALLAEHAPQTETSVKTPLLPLPLVSVTA